MPKYTLHYFNARGRAEVTRLLLQYAGIEFVDTRFSFEEWPELKKNEFLFPFGQCPSLEVDGKIIAQSLAMSRYVATQHGLAGANAMENGIIDMLVDQFNDIRSKLSPFYYSMDSNNAELNQKRKQFSEEYLPGQLSHLEKYLLKNNEGKGFFVGDKVTWVDFSFMDLVQVLEEVDANAFEKFPVLKAHVLRIRELPKIKEYLANRPVTKF